MRILILLVSLLAVAVSASAQMPPADSRADSTKWDYDTRGLWPIFAASQWRIDACARPLALDLPWDVDRHWPSFCNRFRSTDVVTSRVAVLRAALDSLQLPAEQLAELKRGNLWLGAPTGAVELLWGIPYRKVPIAPAAGTMQTWYFDHGSIDLVDGLVRDIRGAPRPS
jgi:hypothetical protein